MSSSVFVLRLNLTCSLIDGMCKTEQFNKVQPANLLLNVLRIMLVYCGTTVLLVNGPISDEIDDSNGGRAMARKVDIFGNYPWN